MDKEFKDFMNEKMLQIKNISEDLDYSATVLDIEKTEVPTINISIAKNQLGEDICVVCNLLPMELYDTPVLFLQFYIILSNPIPDEKKQLIDQFIVNYNEGFLIGNLFECEDRVCLKYSLYLDIESDIDEELFSRTLDIFTVEAHVLSTKILKLVNGEMSLEETFKTNAFSL